MVRARAIPKCCEKSGTRQRSKIHITNNLRVIQHAWHFWYTAVLGVEVPCGGLVIACFTP
ncbi:DUF3265 domain-containing protein [Vibrio parahaemolyticus]|nr:DUF3265 domain-containing protein [Vibrio vulnificus]